MSPDGTSRDPDGRRGPGRDSRRMVRRIRGAPWRALQRCLIECVASQLTHRSVRCRSAFETLHVRRSAQGSAAGDAEAGRHEAGLRVRAHNEVLAACTRAAGCGCRALRAGRVFEKADLASATQEPDDEAQDHADDDHGRERREELEAGFVDDQVAGEASEAELRDPRPEQANQSDQQADGDEGALHGSSIAPDWHVDSTRVSIGDLAPRKLRAAASAG